MNDFTVSQKEREYLRQLANKQLEYSNLPVMDKRKDEWFRHNDDSGERPMVIMEINPFRHELYPPLKCESELARQMEDSLMFNIINHEVIDDDKVVPDYFPVELKINMKEHGFDRVIRHAKDAKGRDIGFSIEHPIKDLKDDFHRIKSSVYSHDKEYTLRQMEAINDIIGDILPVTFNNNSLQWYMAFTARAVNLMGLETLMYSMVDYPEETHKLFSFILEDSMEYMKWQEKEGLLTLNNGNDKAGAGSYGFTKKLPTEECKKTGKVKLKDLWGNLNSQESVGISPSMYEEFIFPYYKKAAKEFGLTYYGCCEPVHTIWENCISKLPNLKKVSVSAWCDENYMGEVLSGTDVIYSRKPSPNFIGVGDFDEDAFRDHISKTLKATRNCKKEIIFRDIYTLDNNPLKAKRAIEIVRELISII